jgi:hypothetical protein
VIKRNFLKAAGATVAAGAAAGMAGCGERPQVIEYKQGNYQGKSDNPPWDSATFKGNKGEWERVIKARSQNQNEYRRTT